MPVIKKFDFVKDVEPMLSITLPTGLTVDLLACTKGEYEKVVHRLYPVTKTDFNEIDDAEAERIIEDLYESAAELMSHNTAKLAFTAEDLRDKHDITPERLLGFYDIYTEFTEDIFHLKN